MHNLALMVINDGDGSQCGATYRYRCWNVGFPDPLPEFQRMCRKADAWCVKECECDPCTEEEIHAAAVEVCEYYRQHRAELDEITLRKYRR